MPNRRELMERVSGLDADVYTKHGDYFTKRTRNEYFSPFVKADVEGGSVRLGIRDTPEGREFVLKTVNGEEYASTETSNVRAAALMLLDASGQSALATALGAENIVEVLHILLDLYEAG